MPRDRKITAIDIRHAMSKRWAAPEWALMWEVGEATGAMAKRYADAVMMSLWPSRGLELHGVEIKISRADWRREAADPGKAEAVARYCDRWWIHTAPGVVDDLSDVPPTWGLREFDGKSWKTVREAEKTPAEAISRPFLAALLRRADGMMRAMIEESAREGQEKMMAEAEENRKRWREEIEKGVQRRTESLAYAADNIAKFDAAFGEGFASSWQDMARIGRAARALADCDDKGYGKLSDRLRRAAAEIDAIQAISEPAKEQADG